MIHVCQFRFEFTRGKKDLWSCKLTPSIREQLAASGRSEADRSRYRVDVEVREGRLRPAHDVDNYYKPIIDSIKYCKGVWMDDEQIDEIRIRRIKEPSQEKTQVVVTIYRLSDGSGAQPRVPNESALATPAAK